MDVLGFAVLLSVVLNCNGDSQQEQLGNIARRYADNSVILGAPSYPSHLPEAEPILPGHTLIRPSMGMLKSAVKFPHRDSDNGAGVYGNIKNLGLRYDSKNERVLYSGFRRTAGNIESNSDEESSMRLRNENYNRQRNYITRYINIFPAETTLKLKQPRNAYPKIKNLILSELKSNVKKNSKKPWIKKIYAKIRPKRYIQRSLNNKLYTSDLTHKFAKLLLDKLKESKQPTKQQSIIVLQPGYHELSNEFYSLEDLNRPRSDSRESYAFSNGIKNLARQRRQQNIAIIKSEDRKSKYNGGVDNSLENITVVTKRPRNWFYKDMKAFNHIKINQDAPDQEEFMPKDSNKDDVKSWWYYHQDDFTPF